MTSKSGFLLLGFPRSGTTLLARLLNGHPAISCPPETYSMAAAARFLHEQTRVEGPPIGILSGLGFCGISENEVLDPLRKMVIGHQERLAGSAQVWIEKTAINVFHLESLETLLAGHVRFIILERNPLDVVVSNIALSEVMGAQLSELFNLNRDTNSPIEALAKAWADRARALDAFYTRQNENAHRLTYEDLTRKPEKTLENVFEFIGFPNDPGTVIKKAFAAPPPVGLGDFNIDMTKDIRPAVENKWRNSIGKSNLARILPILEDEMNRIGYKIPKTPRIPDRAEAIRQLQMSANLKRDIARRSNGDDS